jgi:predicted permease
MWSDIKLAARLLVKERGFTLAAVAALALGIAANNTVFTLINGVFLRDLPFADPDRIVSIQTRNLGNVRNPIDNMSFPDVQDLRASSRTFAGIGLVDQATMNVSDSEHPPERFPGAYISADGFALIGQRPLLGRDFTPDDDRAGAEPVVILGHSVWRNRYGGATDIVGRAIRVNGVSSTVVGVMPDGFGFPDVAQLWQPLAVSSGPWLADRGQRDVDAFGRMAPDITIEQAEADLTAVMERLARAYPDTNRNVAARVTPYRDRNTGGPVRITFTALTASVVFLLLIACANVANLLLARGMARAREISVRLSLGATRAQIVRQLLVESVVLATFAGVVGVALSFAGVRFVATSIRGTGEPYWLRFPMDAPVLAFIVAVCLGTAVLFGLVPALHASRTGIAGMLNDAGRGAAGSIRNRRWTGGLVVVQLSLTLVLLTGASLTMRNVMALARVDAGVPIDDIVMMRVNLPPQQYATPEQRRVFYRQLEERIAGAPGMRAGIGAWAPLRGAFSRRVTIEGQRQANPDDRPRVSNVVIGTGYFDALGVRPSRGRSFSANDGDVAIVNERFAALHFPGREAVGRWIELDATGRPDAPASGRLTIVGVVPDIRHEEFDVRIVEPVVYVPLASNPLTFATIVVRSSLSTAVVASAMRTAISAVDRDLPIFDAMTLTDNVAIDLQPFRVFGSLFGVFAVVALVLATVGLYAVTSFSIVQRRREIGVRIALGAGPGNIWWVVSRRAAVQLGIGLVLGLAGALGMGQVLQGVLSGVSGRDPVTLIAVPALLIVAAVAACIGPASRAIRVDPVVALRAE